MNQLVLNLIDALIRVYPPDMTREDDDNTRRECYSETQLHSMLRDKELVFAICQANEGIPLWRESVRNFLIARAT
jgi:hypothetical protein